MNINREKLQASADELLARIGSKNLTELSQNLPSAITSDVHLLSAEQCLSEASKLPVDSEVEHESLLWSAVQNMSQTQSTLYFHRQEQKLLRQSLSAQKSNRVSQQYMPGMTASSPCAKDIISGLPEGWVILLISCGSEGKARLTHSNPDKYKLHIARATTGSDSLLVTQTVENCEDALLQELELIKEQNKLVNKDYADDPSKYSSVRESLDDRLRRVVRDLECSWLGVWRYLLQGELSDSTAYTKLVKLVNKAVKQSEIGSLSQQQIHKLVLAVSSPSVQISETSALNNNCNKMEPSLCRLRPVVAAILETSVRSIEAKNLSTALQEMEDSFVTVRKMARGPIILVLDKLIVSLPWESMACLKEQTVTRMPSLLCLHSLYKNQKEQHNSLLSKGINPNKGYYVLDPGNNLPRTREKLTNVFESTGWPGICAAKPSHQQFKDALTQFDVFVYVGHGSGSQYLPGDIVEELCCKAAVLLYGCSSVRLQPRGYTPDPWGVILNYMLGHCPTVLGMLWEVTDKDTDMLTDQMLRSMMKAMKGKLSNVLFPSLISKSRHLCKRYLTAAAVTVYGLPITLNGSS